MRAIFIFSLLFFVFGFAALPTFADYRCAGTGQTFTGNNAQTNCRGNCLNGSCVQTSGGGTGGAASTCAPGQFCNPLTSQSFEALVQSLANWVAAIALPIVAIFIIYSGFLFVTAGGNQSKIDAAKTTFYWTVIGTAIVVGAWALATAIVNFAKGL